MENNFSGDLFVSRDYREFTFKYKDVVESIKHCDSATTDFDLTGQIVWPASEALAMYIVDHSNEFTNRTVLELGAGAGLSGIVCSNFCKRIILTDGNDLVVELLSLNAEAVLEPRSSRIRAAKFDWKDYRQFYAEQCSDVDMIIGADIMFWPSSMRPLCECIRHMSAEQLSARQKTLRTIVALQSRSNAAEAEFDAVLLENGLRRTLLDRIKNVAVWEIAAF